MKKTFVLILFFIQYLLFANNNVNIDSLIEEGNKFFEQDNYNEALKIYNFCAKYSDSLNIAKGIYLSNINIGNLYSNWEEDKTALGFYKTALKAALLTGNKEQIAGSYNSIGNSYSNLTKYDSALIYYERAYSFYKETGKNELIAGILNNIGTIYIKSDNNITEGNNYFLEAYNIAKKTDDRKLSALLAINIASNFRKLKNYNKAVEYTKISEKLSDSLNSTLFKMRVYHSYSKIYSDIGNYRKAYDYYLKYHKLQQDIFNEDKHKQFAEMQTKYETIEKQQQIDLLKKNEELKAIKIYRQRITIIVSIVGILLLSFILYQRVKQSKLKQNLLEKEKKQLEYETSLRKAENEKLAELIAHKEREMVASTMHLLQKNELLQKLKSQLDKLTYKEYNYELDNLSKAIESNINTEKDWEVFKVHFQEVNPDFFKNLKSSFPKLTQNDLKICAYIKIGLSNKEIAKLLNILPDSVKSTKKRLKKKLNLTAENDLTEFISKI